MRRVIVFLGMIMMMQLIAQAQTVEMRDSIDNESVVLFKEKMPEFPGGEEAMNQHIIYYLEYPTAAVKYKNVSGRVIAKFTIQPDGSVDSVHIIKPLHPELDAQYIRAIQGMPRWKPGTQNGKPVPVIYTLPIRVDF